MQATTSATDAELVGAVRAGDDNAFDELFRRYHPRVHAFVRRRVRDEGRAEDLTQEAFLSALRRLRETDSRVVFRPWIYEIARNATIDHFRRGSRADEVSVDAVDQLRPSDHLRLVSDRGPERDLAIKQRLEILRGAFDELSDRHERILVMRELEGLSYREIGERMELTRPGVESTLFRARRRLEDEFAELETGRRCTTVRGAMGRLAEGMDQRGDRGRVSRHVRRCVSCRATARELGLLSTKRSRAARVAAVLPLPAIPGALSSQAAALVAAVAIAGGGVGLGIAGVTGDAKPAASPASPSPAPGTGAHAADSGPGESSAAHRRAPVGEAHARRISAPISLPAGEPAPAAAPKTGAQTLPEAAVPRLAVPQGPDPAVDAPDALASPPPVPDLPQGDPGALVDEGTAKVRSVLDGPPAGAPAAPRLPAAAAPPAGS